MKIIEYKKDRYAGDEAPLLRAKRVEETTLTLNATYEGTLDKIKFPLSGTHVLLVKKEDAKNFLAGHNQIKIRYIKLKEYYHTARWLTHWVDSYINCLVVDEVKAILETFPDEEYAVLSAVSIGQHFEYTKFVKDVDYTVEESTTDKNDFVHTYTFVHEEAKEYFDYEMEEEEMCSIQEVLDEIQSWKKSEDVFFVRHPYGTGFATKDKQLLEQIAGYVYENYLIEE